MKAELAHDAAGAAQFPGDGLPEVAVAGRSNVGKSSFINALLGRRKLARSSTTPGKTRRIHFYRVEERAYLVDLPGYGYAAVGRQERRGWRPLVESYLRGGRASLRGAILLIDSRRGPQREELDLLRWLAAEGIDARAVFTKSDKLKAAALAERRASWAERLPLPGADIAWVSSRSGRGLAEPGRWIAAWTGVTLRRPDGAPLLN
ncbi:MAG: YihA family ribosome biogenesis GTP-binding protein [Proteobacteria bacterium]|nr:YihA family ribosome biogenesis GTP-binding protein [Pseudomonadota bacterium]